MVSGVIKRARDDAGGVAWLKRCRLFRQKNLDICGQKA
jgi:hypothetical protein